MLVTVVVITYNSSKYVEETLNSIARQSYKDIELIISDDCSTDSTSDICNSWLQYNKDRFNNAIFVSTSTNGGICANYNNALKFVSGKWIKYIAGDDFLTDDCIEEFVNASISSDCKIHICGTLPFSSFGSLSRRLLPAYYFTGGAEAQERIILKKGTIIEGPTLFLETETLKKLNGFDEKYPFIEDYPLYMKYLAQGYRINLVEKHLIHYREYPESVSRSNPRFSKSIFDAIDDIAVPACWRQKMYLYWYHYKIDSMIRNYHKIHGNKKWIGGYILRVFDLVHYQSKLKILF